MLYELNLSYNMGKNLTFHSQSVLQSNLQSKPLKYKVHGGRDFDCLVN